MNFDATKKIKYCYTRTNASKKKKKNGCHTRTNQWKKKKKKKKKKLQSNVLYFAKKKISRSKVWNESIWVKTHKRSTHGQMNHCNSCMRTCNNFSWGVCWVSKVFSIFIHISIMSSPFSSYFIAIWPKTLHQVTIFINIWVRIHVFQSYLFYVFKVNLWLETRKLT